MRKVKNLVRCLVLIGIMAFILAGCGTSKKETQMVSLVLGVHKYFPKITLNSESIYNQVYDTCYSYGNCSAVVIDGKPFVAFDYNIEDTEKKIDETKRKQIAKQNTEQIISSITSISAKEPEIDTISAIKLSANTLNSSNKKGKKNMIIYDSGLSTKSILNFSKYNIIDIPVDEIVKELSKEYAIPDLAEIDEIRWVGLGETCGEQEELTDKYKHRLQEIWDAILKKGGAKKVVFEKTPVSNEENDMELPKCSTVPVIEDKINFKESKISSITKYSDNTSVKFVADKADFIDEKAAAKELEPIIKYLKDNMEEKIYIFGMTATAPGGDNGIKLSKQRAEKCKSLLVRKGVNKNQLICKGLGQFDNSLRVRDTDENGNLIEKLAIKNRAVVFIKSGHNLVDELLKCAESEKK